MRRSGRAAGNKDSRDCAQCTVQNVPEFPRGLHGNISEQSLTDNKPVLTSNDGNARITRTPWWCRCSLAAVFCVCMCLGVWLTKGHRRMSHTPRHKAAPDRAGTDLRAYTVHCVAFSLSLSLPFTRVLDCVLLYQASHLLRGVTR